MNKSVKLPEKTRILVVRPDRIGDVVLSLPVITSIRKACPKSHIGVLCREYTADIFKMSQAKVDTITTIDTPGSGIPAGQFFDLLQKIRKEKYDIAITLYAKFSVAFLVAMAGIPTRIGPSGKLAGLFFNHRLRQHRSKAGRHEADHNLDLLKPLGIPPVRIGRLVVETGKMENKKPVIGIHPGSGGSSLNWPPVKYAQLAARLSNAGYAVTVTGSPAEKKLVQKVADESCADPSVYIGGEGIKKLAEKINSFDVFVAGSTGPVHIAGAVETPAVGIYSPVKVCLPERWGPIGKDDVALLPENIGPCETCIGKTCADYNCMENIDVLTVKEAIISILQKKKTVI